MTVNRITGFVEVDRLKTGLSIEQYGIILMPSDTTPSVRDARTCIAKNTSPVNVTRFDDGQEGQVIEVLGDGQTTIVHYAGGISVANGMKIRCLSGADTLLVADTMYKYVCMRDLSSDTLYWLESGSSAGGGGGGGLTFAEAMSISSLGG